MPGRAALTSVDAAMSDIRSTRKGEHNAGISGSDTSEIGGAGRKGGPMTDPPYTRIDAQVMGKAMNGMATGGVTGYDAGFGRTFGAGGSKRAED